MVAGTRQSAQSPLFWLLLWLLGSTVAITDPDLLLTPVLVNQCDSKRVAEERFARAAGVKPEEFSNLEGIVVQLLVTRKRSEKGKTPDPKKVGENSSADWDRKGRDICVLPFVFHDSINFACRQLFFLSIKFFRQRS